MRERDTETQRYRDRDREAERDDRDDALIDVDQELTSKIIKEKAFKAEITAQEKTL